MSKWVASPIALLASLIGFAAGFYATIVVSFAIGSRGQGIGVALDGIWMPVATLGAGALLAGLLGGVAATRDARGTMLAVLVALVLAVLGIVIILLGSPELETVMLMGVLIAIGNAVISMTDWLRYKNREG